MFDRFDLKQQAKQILARNWITPFLICLIVGLFMGSFIQLDFNFSTHSVTLDMFRSYNFKFNYYPFTLFAFFGSVLVFAWKRLISVPLEVGLAHYFHRNSNNQAEISDVLLPFQQNYLNNVFCLFHRDILIVLWTLLFIIPGIVKAYSYTFVPYLLAEYPNSLSSDVLEMSAEMTNGLKMDIFILDISFFLWSLLAAVLSFFTLGLSYTAVEVYRYQTRAELYQWCKQNRQ